IGDATVRAVADGSIQGAVESPRVPAAEPDGLVGVERVGRLYGNVVDRAAGRVSPVQRALRTLEHLDALDIEELSVEEYRICRQHIVDVDAHAARVVAVEIVETDAADREDRRASRSGVDGGQSRRLIGDVLVARKPELLDVPGAERGDGDAD